MVYSLPVAFRQQISVTAICFAHLARAVFISFAFISLFFFLSFFLLVFSDYQSHYASLLSYTGRIKYGMGKRGHLSEAIELPLST